MRSRWKIALWGVGAVIIVPAILFAPPTSEFAISVTCHMKPLTENCVKRMRAMGHVWSKLGFLDRAITWYGRAASEGDDTESYFHLGWAYEERGYRQIMPKMRAHRKALEQATAKLQAEFKARSAASLPTPTDTQELPDIPEPNLREDFQLADGAYRKAAERGFAPAMNNLGQMHVSVSFGSNRRRDGAAFILRAARAGNPFGALNAALIYTDGIGVPRDEGEAIRWGQWNGEHVREGDLIYPTLEHSRMALSGDADPRLVFTIREAWKRRIPLDATFKPLNPDPRLPTFQSVLDGLKKQTN